jgi:DNA invertase Pin-like site-specific DNA recombinase
MKVAAYARVSTNNHHQDPEVQLRDIRDYCDRKGWELTQVYVDKGISGTKSSRPELNRLMVDVETKRFDGVIVWKFDRFARSSAHLINSLDKFKVLGMAFVSVQDSIDTSTAMGECMFTIIAAFAQFERSVTVERIKAGLRNAKAKGHLPGKKRRLFDLPAIRERMSEGESLRKVAKTLRISPALLSRRLNEQTQKQTS